MPQNRESNSFTLPNGNHVTITIGSNRRGVYKTVSVRRPDGTRTSRTYRRGGLMAYFLGAYNSSVPSWAGGGPRVPTRTRAVTQATNSWKTFAAELAHGIAKYESEYKQVERGGLQPSGELLVNPAPQVNRLCQELPRLVSEIGQWIAAHQPGGVQVAPRDLVAEIVSVYASMIALANEVRSANVPAKWQPVYSALLESVRQPLRQIRKYSSLTTQGVTADLNIDINPVAIQALAEALAAVSAKHQPGRPRPGGPRSAFPRP